MLDCLGPGFGTAMLNHLLSDRRLREDCPDVTLPRLMVARQPMFRLGWLAGRDRLQRTEIDRFVTALQRCGGPWRATRRARWRRRRARGRAGCRRARARPVPRAARRRAAPRHPPRSRPRSSASAAVSAASSYSRPTQNADCATIMSARPASAPRISRNRLIRTSVNTVVMWSAKSPTVATAPARLCSRPAMKSRNDAPATSIYAPSR